MRRFKTGEKALLEIEFREGDDYGDVCWLFLPGEAATNLRSHWSQIARERVHPHPGVPVADLLEELELLHKMWQAGMDRSNQFNPGWSTAKDWNARVRQLRRAREAAQTSEEPRSPAELLQELRALGDELKERMVEIGVTESGEAVYAVDKP